MSAWSFGASTADMEDMLWSMRSGSEKIRSSFARMAVDIPASRLMIFEHTGVSLNKENIYIYY